MSVCSTVRHSSLQSVSGRVYNLSDRQSCSSQKTLPLRAFAVLMLRGLHEGCSGSGRRQQWTVIFQTLAWICSTFSSSSVLSLDSGDRFELEGRGSPLCVTDCLSKASHVGARIESPGTLGSAPVAGPHPHRFRWQWVPSGA